MKTKLYTKTLQKIQFFLTPTCHCEVRSNLRAGVGVLLFFLLPTFTGTGAGYAQLINAPADCPIAYRLCDAQASYHFQLVDAGLIDDAHGSLNIQGLNLSSPGAFEGKSAFLTFTPKYSGQFGMRICPDTVEKLNFILFQNPNCADLEIGNYGIIIQGISNVQEPIYGCTGIGVDPVDQFNQDFVSPLINIQAGITYGIFVRTAYYLQTGSHRFTLTFQGDAVTTHPDLFDNAVCQLATNDIVAKVSTINVFPNPFSEKVTIASNVLLQKTELYNLLGEKVFAQDFSNEIDTGFLQAGVYILKLYGADNAVFVRKIVKK
jgi:Secretion system C-terminal sorting domain